MYLFELERVLRYDIAEAVSESSIRYSYQGPVLWGRVSTLEIEAPETKRTKETRTQQSFGVGRQERKYGSFQFNQLSSFHHEGNATR